MTVFGPHCPHNECSWIACDHAEPPASGVYYGCAGQANCPYCGPTSPEWGRLCDEWVDWCIGRYGTANSDELWNKGGIPSNVLATAELVEKHPRGDR